MKNNQIRAALFCLSVFLMAGLGTTVGHAGAMDLISTLTSTLGITEKQAEGGTGALFQNAKENLSAEDLKKVSDVVPGMDSYLAAAPKAESKPGLEGALGNTLSSLGGGAAKAGNLLDLNSAFSKLGMDSSTLGKFVPIVLDFVQSEGGQSVVGLLKGLWQ